MSPWYLIKIWAEIADEEGGDLAALILLPGMVIILPFYAVVWMVLWCAWKLRRRFKKVAHAPQPVALEQAAHGSGIL